MQRLKSKYIKKWLLCLAIFSADYSFYVPDNYYCENFEINNFEDFKLVVNVIKFWGFDEAPRNLLDFIMGIKIGDNEAELVYNMILFRSDTPRAKNVHLLLLLIIYSNRF